MTDTIAAIATARTPAAIGIVRISGPETLSVADRVFRAKNGKPAADQATRRMLYGHMRTAEGTVIDDGLCVLFPPQSSYTGQWSAELHCHGSPVVLDEVLRSTFAAGARQARGGEFTKRAFLSGRMDLIQAEAVADLIDAETAESAQNAALQLSGALSRGVERVYGDLMDITSRFYAAVDYPDEDIEPPEHRQIADTLTGCRRELQRLLDTFPTPGNRRCLTPCWAMTGPSSPRWPAPPGTPWRKRSASAASFCGCATPQASGRRATAWKSWAWTGPWRRRSRPAFPWWCWTAPNALPAGRRLS